MVYSLVYCITFNTECKLNKVKYNLFSCSADFILEKNGETNPVFSLNNDKDEEMSCWALCNSEDQKSG